MSKNKRKQAPKRRRRLIIYAMLGGLLLGEAILAVAQYTANQAHLVMVKVLPQEGN